MAGKRNYWLKLCENFFDQLAIKKLRKVAGGDTYTLIYVEMMLKSINTNGILTYECDDEDEFAENLALDINEDEENVKMTMAFLLKHGLMLELPGGDKQLVEVPNCVGSETPDAERKRKKRAELKKIGQNTDNVRLMSGQRPENVSLEIDTEKDIEIDIDKDTTTTSSCSTESVADLSLEAKELVALWNDKYKVLGFVNSVILSDLTDFIGLYGFDNVKAAIEEASRYSYLQKPIKMVKKIAENMANHVQLPEQKQSYSDSLEALREKLRGEADVDN